MALKLIKKGGQYYCIDENTVIVGTTDKSLLEHKPLSTKELSLKNCEAIERGYDLVELVKERFGEAFWHDGDKYYKEGFQKALELLEHKKYTEDDLFASYETGWEQRHEEKDDYNLTFNKFVKSLNKSEWDVEIEMEDSKVVDKHEWDGSNDGELTWVKRPKLDVDGCLILKRK